MIKKTKINSIEITTWINEDCTTIIANTFLVKDKLAMQVDAGTIFEEKIDILILTHAHHDHIAYASQVKEKNPECIVMASKKAAEAIETLNQVTRAEFSKIDIKPVMVDKKLKEGDIINTGTLKFKIISTPGHTNGSICLWEQDKKILFTGDTFFEEGIYGRTDLPTGSSKELFESLDKIKKLNAKVIFAGH